MNEKKKSNKETKTDAKKRRNEVTRRDSTGN